MSCLVPKTADMPAGQHESVLQSQVVYQIPRCHMTTPVHQPVPASAQQAGYAFPGFRLRTGRHADQFG